MQEVVEKEEGIVLGHKVYHRRKKKILGKEGSPLVARPSLEPYESQADDYKSELLNRLFLSLYFFSGFLFF